MAAASPLVALALAAQAAVAAAPRDRCVEIVGTNDLHGHVAPEATLGQGREAGGLAWFGGYLKTLRAGSRPVLLLDAGDLFQGTLESNLSHGRAVIEAYNLLGYDAAVLGNHEFDFGAEPPEVDLLASIRHRLAEANFPFLAANVFDRRTGKRPAWKHLLARALVREGPLRVGLVGIAHPLTPSLTLRRNVDGLEFSAAEEPVAKEAQRLRAEGADLVVLVAHFGGRCGDLSGTADEASCEPAGRMQRLLRALPPGTVDVAIAGHTHQFMANWIAGVPTLEAGFGGRAFDWLTACARPGGGLDRAASRLHPPVAILPHGTFEGRAVEEDVAVARALAPFVARVRNQARRRVGPVLAEPLRRDYNAPSPLGTVVARALRRYTHADASLVNPGGLRADLPRGPLTYGALYQALPFENQLVVLNVTGRKLLELMSALIRSGHGFPQIAGLALVGPPGAFTGAVFSDGRPLRPEGSYRLATVEFLASGGDGLGEAMAGVPQSSLEVVAGTKVLRDVVLDYLANKGPRPGWQAHQPKAAAPP